MRLAGAELVEVDAVPYAQPGNYQRVAERLAAERASVADIDRLAAVVAEQERAAARGEPQAFHAADELFHETIASVAGHPGIWRLLRPVKAQLDRCRMLTLPVPGRMDQVIAEHREVLAALRARDAAASAAALDRHLGAVVPDTDVLRARHPGYFV